MSTPKARIPTASKPMCVVSVDFQYLMLPADKGMKLVELLQSAVRVEPEYRDRDYSYQVGEQPSVEYKSVKASQVRMPTSPAAPVPGSNPALRTNLFLKG